MIPESAWPLALTIAGVFGLAIGSFLNVVVYRVPAKQSLVPASRCPKCEAPIRAWQNIPVVSWLLLGGRCASCKTRISPRYPLIELATAAAFVGVTWWWIVLGATPAILIAYLLLASVSIALTLIDLDTYRLPNVIVLPASAVFASCVLVDAALSGDWFALLRAVIGGLALSLLYAILWFAKPGGMGLGDVKLAILLGMAMAWIGWGTLVVGAFAAFAFGGIFGLGLMLTRRGGMKSRIPFGPWMILGAWSGMLWGHQVASWYLTTFFAA